MRWSAAAFAAFWLIATALPAQAASGARLRGLDKISGQARDFIAPLNRPVMFGALSITARACEQRPPEETPPETSAYLTITQTHHAAAKGGGAPVGDVEVFRGWMFASSPALHALEHPTYDVWVISCAN